LAVAGPKRKLAAGVPMSVAAIADIIGGTGSASRTGMAGGAEP